MARKKSKPLDSAYVLFDVIYEDDSRRSNRRVPSSLVGGLDGDAPVLQFLIEQDEAIAEKSGRPRLEIKRMVRSEA
ncbi:hypothetical protein [Labrys wisconsinensis]|uniref:Uncharacterized protein n=1 Tax=Labrys wisconsinensis TaxID=425677 RepID=A0ABU0IZ59_9HYPH|nr:hypothetical protein [Labrys wisconsinensis]MDQ0467302.1 hypothetical protein [Labrys wisconsinensis]